MTIARNKETAAVHVSSLVIGSCTIFLWVYTTILFHMLHDFKHPFPWPRIHTPSVASKVSQTNIRMNDLLTLVA